MNATPTPRGDLTAAFIAGAPGRTYPPDVIDMAKRCLVDWMGVAVGAAGEGATASVRRVAEGWGAAGNGQILLGPKTAPALAALVNGTMAHCMDYDDSHFNGGGHVGAPTWAAALALASHLGLSERETLGGFITGFEVMGRLGGGGWERMARPLQVRGFHPTSVWGRLGAAAVAGALLGLDEARAAHALGVAATTVGGLNASFGTMSKPFHAGKAAMDGILAAQLAAEGFEAATHLLDADNGLAGALIQDRSTSMQPVQFTEGWEVLRNEFKPYACCRAAHPVLDAARALAPRIAGREVARVRSWLHQGALVLAGKTDPRTPLEGKFSTAYCIALGLRGHAAVATDFTEERLRDPAVMDIVPRVTCQETPDLERYEARLEVELADGETLHGETAIVLGHPDNPMSWDDLETKFVGVAGPVLGSDTRPLLAALRDFDRPGALAEVLALVAR